MNISENAMSVVRIARMLELRSIALRVIEQRSEQLAEGADSWSQKHKALATPSPCGNWSQEQKRRLMSLCVPSDILMASSDELYEAHVRELLDRSCVEDMSIDGGTYAEAYAGLLVADKGVDVVPFTDTVLGAVMIQLLGGIATFLGERIADVPPNVSLQELKSLLSEIEHRHDAKARNTVVNALLLAATKDRKMYEELAMGAFSAQPPYKEARTPFDVCRMIRQPSMN